MRLHFSQANVSQAFSLWLVLFTAGAGAQSLPQIGEMLDAGGSMRPVFGVAGNFMVGVARKDRVLSAACSARLCLAKTDLKILSPTGSVPAPSGPALIAIQDDNALIYFQQSQVLARWHDNALVSLNWNVRGTLLSLRAGPEVAVRRNNRVSIVRPDGFLVEDIPGATGPVLLLADGILLVSQQKLILRRPNVPELRFDLPDIESLSTLGEHYVQIRARIGSYALRTEPGFEQLYVLPGSPR